MKQFMFFHPKGMASSGNTSLCAVLTLNSLHSPKNALGEGHFRVAWWNTEHGQAHIPWECRRASVHGVNGADPDPRCHGWLHKVLVLLLNSKCRVKTAAPAYGLFSSLFRLPPRAGDSISSFFQVLHSPSQWGGNIARMKFHKFLCMNETEALEDRAEGEGKSAEFSVTQSGANPQRRKISLPPGAQYTVLTTAETHSWALLSKELCLWTFSCIYRSAGIFI